MSAGGGGSGGGSFVFTGALEPSGTSPVFMAMQEPQSCWRTHLY